MPRHQFLSEETQLLAAIHADPREDTPRLVYADWLQEHEQPEYAEFIRWQCQNPAEMKIPRPSAKTLAKWRVEVPSSVEERMRQRLGLNFGQWGRPCPSDTDLATFCRGLPITTVKWVMSQSEAFDRLLTAANPRLRFQLPLDESTLGFLSHPIFARAESVSLCPVGQAASLTDNSIIALSTWPRIGSIRTVQLWRVLERDGERVRGMFPASVGLNISVG